MTSVFQAPPRPRITSTITYAAAEVIAKRLAEAGEGVDDPITVQDLIEHYDPDGIEFANNLRANTLAELDGHDVSILDGMDMEIELLLAKEQQEWVKANDIQPRYRKEDRVMLQHPTRKEVMEAIISSVNLIEERGTSPATYVVAFPEARDLTRWILPFEAVEQSSEYTSEGSS